MTDREPRREDLQAALGARRELGPDYEDAVLDSFLERMDRSIDARVDARVAEQAARPGVPGRPGREERQDRGRDPVSGGFALGMVSLGTGIPITAIAASQGLAELLVAWGGIAAVNAAHAFGRHRSR